MSIVNTSNSDTNLVAPNVYFTHGVMDPLNKSYGHDIMTSSN